MKVFFEPIFKTAIFILIICICQSTTINAFTDLDLEHYPFSHYGSYMCIVKKSGSDEHPAGHYIQDISGRRMWQWKGIFKLDFLQGNKPVEVKVTASPSKLIFKSDKGITEICFDGPNTLRFRSKNMSIRLTQHVKDGSSQSFPISCDGNQWRIQMGGYDNYVLTGLKGTLAGDPAKTVTLKPIPDRPQLIISILPDNLGLSEAAFEQYQDGWVRRDYKKNFDACVEESRGHFEGFKDKLLPVPDKYKGLFELAHYVKWSSVVGVKDLVKREAFYCSKNWMNGIWPWDNCFSAMATSRSDMQWAINQILVIFDHQTYKGAIPGLLTDQNIMWGSYKPPVQGLAFSKIMQHCKQQATTSQLVEIYEPVALYTNFWFNHLDDNQNGIPQYNHANDSGEDNGAVFESGYPSESPDLCAFLILQLDFLEDIATQLGKHAEAKEWKRRSDHLLKFLVTELWTGEKFVAKNSITGKYEDKAHAFLQYTPIILGEKLPESIRKKLIQKLKAPNSIVTPYGPASEHPDSPFFYEDGYWRGAVWAPQYYFLVEGLAKCGEKEWANKLAANYAEMCLNSGFPENFSALNGRPLKDTGYSWTVDVFLALSFEYLVEKPASSK